MIRIFMCFAVFFLLVDVFDGDKANLTDVQWAESGFAGLLIICITAITLFQRDDD